MKKTVIALIALLLITGCGSKTKDYTCTYSTDSGENKLVIHFSKDGKQLKSYDQVMTISLSEIDDEDYESAVNSCKEINDKYKGVKCDINKDSKNATYKLTYDLSKLTDDEKKTFDIDEIENKSYDEFVDYMKDSPYTCK